MDDVRDRDAAERIDDRFQHRHVLGEHGGVFARSPGGCDDDRIFRPQVRRERFRGFGGLQIDLTPAEPAMFDPSSAELAANGAADKSFGADDNDPRRFPFGVRMPQHYWRSPSGWAGAPSV